MLFTLADIPQIPNITLDTKFAQRCATSRESDFDDMIDTARHEASHMVVSIACHSNIDEAAIKYAGARKGWHGKLGACHYLEVHEMCDALAGVAFEHLYGTPCRADNDLEYACNVARRSDVDVNSAYLAVEQYLSAPAAQVAKYAAVGLLGLRTQSGVIHPSKLNALAQWLKPRTPELKYLRRFSDRRRVTYGRR